MRIGIREIAQLARVSSATVSRVLNNSDLVTDDTRLRVQKIIRDLNFVPNNSAIHLKEGRSNVFGIVIPDITNPFFTELVKVFEELLVENHYDLIVANTDFHDTRAQKSLHRMLLRRVDGVAMLASEQDTADLSGLVQNRIPVVTADYYRTSNGISDITVDFESGMTQMIRHLKHLGHHKVGFIAGSPGPLTSRIRTRAFLEAVLRQGLTSKEGWIVDGNYQIDGGTEAMAKILSQPEWPTAVVAANDLTAIGALRAAYERKLRVPEDISIGGCDDIQLSDIVHPPLTTLRISRNTYAHKLLEALQVSVNDLSQAGKQYMVPMQLVVRQSTGKASARAGKKNTPRKRRASSKG